ncbi:MAG: threonine--tRNA ligase [Pseudomonadota bacterium]
MADGQSQISLTFPDGNARGFPAGVTAAEVASSISTSLCKKAISATVNGEHWDLAWPITDDASIAIHTIKDEAPSLELIRHSFAHVMARAVQTIWPDVKVTIGPVTEHGWFYDFDRDEPFTPEDLGQIEAKMKEIINARDAVRTEVWDRVAARKFYEDNGEPYKVDLVDRIPDGADIRMYWHGDWQDLCRGPHLQHTGQLPADAFKLMGVSGSHWFGDTSKNLQRIQGVGFRNRDELKAHMTFLEEAEKRDHRRLGREMDLFHMQEEARGQVFWHPNGWKIYTTLMDYMRRMQTRDGYQEVNTPEVVHRALWEASGHWDKYQENMFIVEVDEDHAREKAINALKPMNCPGHVQVFNNGLTSYRDLPMRFCEFGSCHRYEPSGALHGIMRVRGFTQDDGHIFCSMDQITSESKKFIAFLAKVYSDLGFEDWSIKLSTRPEKRIGSDETWDILEESLGDACNAAGYEYELLPGEGAFYGPKLEFTLTDAIGRTWQCGTLQVDTNMPERLGASYIGQDGEKHTPVMLHRATLGSFERFIGILIEEHAGKLPFWLAPRQVVVASITSSSDEFVAQVVDALVAAGVRAEADIRNEKINYKVREHSVGKVPVILAIGQREVEDRTVSMRRLGEKQSVTVGLDYVVTSLSAEAVAPDLH